MYSPMDAIILILIRLLEVYSYIILARVIMSWVIRDPFNKYYIFVLRITEPVLGPIRSLLPRMGLDLSPIIVFILIDIIVRILSGSI